VREEEINNNDEWGVAEWVSNIFDGDDDYYYYYSYTNFYYSDSKLN